jgi:hypothetical protein
MPFFSVIDWRSSFALIRMSIFAVTVDMFAYYRTKVWGTEILFNLVRNEEKQNGSVLVITNYPYHFKTRARNVYSKSILFLISDELPVVPDDVPSGDCRLKMPKIANSYHRILLSSFRRYMISNPKQSQSTYDPSNSHVWMCAGGLISYVRTFRRDWAIESDDGSRNPSYRISWNSTMEAEVQRYRLDDQVGRGHVQTGSREHTRQLGNYFYSPVQRNFVISSRFGREIKLPVQWGKYGMLACSPNHRSQKEASSRELSFLSRNMAALL